MRHFGTRFDHTDAESFSAVGDLPNLVDLMLVFAVGLIAALATVTAPEKTLSQQKIEMSRELPEAPGQADKDGGGLEAVGRVFRDPATGKHYMLSR